ncbi:hypothetical protein HG535_0B04000 [Zygotorulaspora mrakii]|uniref:WKF domain-containing protein n=1 Tax=Zygotorulaspora mrakii TaxID=42260 RepID=A0A7H9AY64_ZYGMR|nr:uncharacterized protein HG535_0B04000 [Zygotorulaspora mrakii]QLG71360.1 hypothetical protein HG535_0B04000 [Zygotorulaspora mrakii]
MTDQHIPAWQRIVIKQQQGKTEDNDFIDEDPLNVTTHLATGTLTKKEKKRIINGRSLETSKKITKKKADANRRRDKLTKEEREDKRAKTVLKDQLRYLIEFHLHKISDEIPKELHALPNVQSNYPKHMLDDRKKKDTVIEIWKFSKQKQNWLIKHFFTISEIPVEYDDILMNYFADLKSDFLRNSLTSKCWDKVKEWNDFAEKEEENIKHIVEADEKEDSTEEQKNESDGKKEQKSDAEKEELIVPPNKDIVSRCVKLLGIWKLDEKDGKLIELKNF